MADIRTDAGANQHIEQLTLMIADLMHGRSWADIDAVAVSAGPGGYTSLRVGASVAKGLCYAHDKSLISIDTLESLARASLSRLDIQAPDTVVALPMLDARRDEVCMAVFGQNGDKKVAHFQHFVSHNMFQLEMISAHIFSQNTIVLLSGTGAKKCLDVLFFENTVNVLMSEVQTCSSAYLAIIAEEKFQMSDFQSVAYFEPYYFKPPQVTQAKKNIF